MSIVRRPVRPDVFGVWIETQPFVRLRGEGIFQLLIRLLHAAAHDPQVRIVVACAAWTEANLRKLMAEHGIPEQAVELIVSRPAVPVVLRWFYAWSKVPPVPRTAVDRHEPRRAAKFASSLFLQATGRVFGSLTWLGLLCGAIVWLLPLSLAATAPAVLIGPYWIARRVWRRTAKSRRHVADRFGLLKSIKAAALGRWLRLRLALLEQVVRREYDYLSAKIAARTDVKVWFVPSQTAHGPRGLSVPLVSALPDAVYFDFPAAFAGCGMPAVHRRIQSLVDRAAAVVSYNEDIRRRHAIDRLGVAPDAARVIRHAPMDAARHLPEALRQGDRPATRRSLAGLIQKHFQSHGASSVSGRVNARYLADLPFHETRYLFVSSQVRPHKNLFNLLSAFDQLLRERHLPLKLFTTGNLAYADPRVRSLLATRNLELDVISVPDLPSDVHAAFYKLAELTVVPTLFEGGFPFPFTESLSVDTPVVMSDIPAVREVLPQSLVPTALFDPYDSGSIADRIQWALEHRAELLEQERSAYAALTERTWDDVAREYFEVFRSVADGNNERRRTIRTVSPTTVDVRSRAG